MARPKVEGQSDKADKSKPMEERIASMLTKTAYRDIRDGFGGMNPGGLGDQAIAGALGMIIKTQGRIGPMVLETHYGCTLMHREHLRRAWENQEEKDGMDREKRCLIRFGCELAIRELASLRFSRGDIGEYAYLLCTKPSALAHHVKVAGQWLEGIRQNALAEVKSRMGHELADLLERREKVCAANHVAA
jgi:hypothetical protein